MNRREKERALWQTWHDTGRTPEGMQPLLNSLKPLIMGEVKRYGGKMDIPEGVLHSWALKHAIEGIQSWDPNHPSKAALGTHVINSIRFGLSRKTKEAQNVGYRISEKRVGKAWRQYQDAVEELETLYGYPPTDQEIAKHLGWSLKEVQRMAKDIRMAQPGTAAIIEEAVTQKVPKEDRAVQNVKFIVRSDPKMGEDYVKVLDLFLKGKSGGQIARQLGFSQGKVSRIRSKLIRLIKDELSRGGT